MRNLEVDGRGWTALHWAAQSGQVKVLRMMGCEARGRLWIAGVSGPTDDTQLLMIMSDVVAKRFRAESYVPPQIVTKLVEMGADPQATDNVGLCECNC